MDSLPISPSPPSRPPGARSWLDSHPPVAAGHGPRRQPGEPPTGLVLSGGGARAAYQVGVLQAVMEIGAQAGAGRDNPFPIIAGTSAGAINASALACRADDMAGAVQEMVEVWSALHADAIYRADALGLLGSGARWLALFSLGWALARSRRARPRSLLDNSPMEQTLRRFVPLRRLPRMMRSEHLRALAVSASSYSTGRHVTFYDSLHDIAPWTRSQRLAVRGPITPRHLLASAAIPFVFPAVPLALGAHTEFCGDGSMRQTAPISPAIHLGAQRVLVVGAGRLHEPPQQRPVHQDYPNLAQIAGHALSSIFLDGLAVDIERLQRINHTLSLLPPQAREHSGLRPIDVLVIAPSQRLDDIAARHVGALPASVRAALRALGVYGRGSHARGSALASYLLFEPPYIHELMALGRTDTLARRDDVRRFFGWDARAEAAAPPAIQPSLTAG